MIQEKVKKTIYRGDISKIVQAHEYVFHMKNITPKRVYTARGLFEGVLASITSQEEECIEERDETEEEAKMILGEEFVGRLEEIISYCDKNQLRLLFHGTHESNIPNILEEGLKSHQNDLSYTSVPPYKDNLYSSLLNWPHKNYKGIVMLAIPYQCVDKDLNGLLPIWNGKENFHLPGYELAPEFIMGGLDIEHKSIIMNDAFTCEHDYSKFKLKNNEVVRSHDKVDEIDENDEDIDSDFDLMYEDEESPDMDSENEQKDNVITPSIPIINPTIQAFIEEENINQNSVLVNEADDAIHRMCEILALWKVQMIRYGHLGDYKNEMQEYYQCIEPYLTDERIEEILDEMKNHPEHFPTSSIIDEIYRKEEIHDDDIPITVKKSKKCDIDDEWII